MVWLNLIGKWWSTWAAPISPKSKCRALFGFIPLFMQPGWWRPFRENIVISLPLCSFSFMALVTMSIFGSLFSLFVSYVQNIKLILLMESWLAIHLPLMCYWFITHVWRSIMSRIVTASIPIDFHHRSMLTWNMMGGCFALCSMTPILRWKRSTLRELMLNGWTLPQIGSWLEWSWTFLYLVTSAWFPHTQFSSIMDLLPPSLSLTWLLWYHHPRLMTLCHLSLIRTLFFLLCFASTQRSLWSTVTSTTRGFLPNAIMSIVSLSSLMLISITKTGE